jgi:uncharacterized protein (TIGR02145 family)
MRKLQAYSFAFVTAVAVGLVACGDDDSDFSALPEKLPDNAVSSVDDLSNCTAKKAGELEFVKDTPYVCTESEGMYKWIQVSQTEDEPEDFKVCNQNREGQYALASDEDILYTCSDEEWIPVGSVSSSDPKSSSSEKSSSRVTSSSVASSSSSSVPSSFSEGDDRSVYDAKNNTLTDYRDGHVYRTLSIGTQTWMAENLNYAYTGVPYYYSGYTSDSTSWCHSNAAANCTKYGRLYTWAAAMDSVGTWSANGKGCGYIKTCSPTYPVRGVCPEGWHLPTQTEWNTLFTAVGGSSTAGKMLKSTSGWYSSGNGTDAYSFSALPAGRRHDDGSYYREGDVAFFWSSTEAGSYYAYYMYLGYGNDIARLNYNGKYYGFSVRCVKD